MIMWNSMIIMNNIIMHYNWYIRERNTLFLLQKISYSHWNTTSINLWFSLCLLGILSMVLVRSWIRYNFCLYAIFIITVNTFISVNISTQWIEFRDGEILCNFLPVSFNLWYTTQYSIIQGSSVCFKNGC